MLMLIYFILNDQINKNISFECYRFVFVFLHVSVVQFHRNCMKPSHACTISRKSIVNLSAAIFGVLKTDYTLFIRKKIPGFDITLFAQDYANHKIGPINSDCNKADGQIHSLKEIRNKNNTFLFIE